MVSIAADVLKVDGAMNGIQDIRNRHCEVERVSGREHDERLITKSGASYYDGFQCWIRSRLVVPVLS